MYTFLGRALFLITVILSVSCSSAPAPSLPKSKVAKARGPASQKAKALPETGNAPVSMVNSRVFYSPRRFEELESAILLNKGVQNCLLSSPLGMVPLAIDIEGRISYSGDTELVSLETSDALVKNCLVAAIVLIKHGRGIQGPFKMRLERAIESPGTGQGLILDKPSVKKFE